MFGAWLTSGAVYLGLLHFPSPCSLSHGALWFPSLPPCSPDPIPSWQGVESCVGEPLGSLHAVKKTGAPCTAPAFFWICRELTWIVVPKHIVKSCLLFIPTLTLLLLKALRAWPPLADHCGEGEMLGRDRRRTLPPSTVRDGAALQGARE